MAARRPAHRLPTLACPVAILGVTMSGEESTTRFSASEVNLLIYHYLKESGFLHTCFALRYEARLDDLPTAREPIVQPGQLLHYLQRGLMYVSAEREVEKVRFFATDTLGRDSDGASTPGPGHARCSESACAPYAAAASA